MDKLSSFDPVAQQWARASVDAQKRHHAYLLTGSTSEVRHALLSAFVASLMCEAKKDVDACEDCRACKQRQAGVHPGIIPLAEHTVDAVREMLQRLSRAGFKIGIIEDAEKLNPAAQNALLKTLEEPPGSHMFILAANKATQMLPTIRSRCQELYLPKVSTLRDDLLGDESIVAMINELVDACNSKTEVAQVLQTAANYGDEKEKAERAQEILEVILRDALARIYGASPEQLVVQTDLGHSPQAIVRAMQALSAVRAKQRNNLNRTMALERIMLSLRKDL